MSDKSYRRGYRDGYKDGYSDGFIDPSSIPFPIVPTINPPEQQKPRCRVCGITFDGPFGYVCTNERCPGRISYSTKPMTYRFGQATRVANGTLWNDDESR